MKIMCSHTDVVDIDSLVPHPRNPNSHSEIQLKYLAKILKHQGWRHPVTVSKRSGFVVAGHGRIEAARLNGWESIPIDKQDFETEADEYAHLIADNKLAELADFDEAMVTEDVAKLGEDFDMDLLGIPDFGEVENVNKGDENSEWVGMPDFQQGHHYIKLIYQFKTEADREAFVKENGISIDRRMNNQWIVQK